MDIETYTNIKKNWGIVSPETFDFLCLIEKMEDESFSHYRTAKAERAIALKNQEFGQYLAFNTIKCMLLDPGFYQRIKEIYDKGETER